MKYFTIKELTASDTAKAKGIDNTPNSAVVMNLQELVHKVLDPLREAWGRPLHVNSGYRCPKLNAAVGGSWASDHMYGQAADITAIEANRKRRIELNKELFELVKRLNLPYKQLIDEKGYTWIHVSYQKGSLKHEIKHL